jgi:hypothetical protein
MFFLPESIKNMPLEKYLRKAIVISGVAFELKSLEECVFTILQQNCEPT